MPFDENTHVSFTSDAGKEEVGIVKQYSGGQYTILQTDSSQVKVAEDKVKKIDLKDASAAKCPVVGHK